MLQELTDHLELTGAEALRSWLARLLDWQLIGQSGRTQATCYFVQPELLRKFEGDAVPVGRLLRLRPPQPLSLPLVVVA